MLVLGQAEGCLKRKNIDRRDKKKKGVTDMKRGRGGSESGGGEKIHYGIKKKQRPERQKLFPKDEQNFLRY